MEIKPPLKLWEKLPLHAFFGDTREETPPFWKLWQQNPPKKGCIFFVGSESGFDDQEIKKFQMLEIHGVKLHTNTLRTDTAPIVALSLIETFSHNILRLRL